MRSRLLSALAGTTLLTLAAVALPSGTASAAVDCTPVADQGSVHITPATLAITSTGYKSFSVAAAFTAACGDADGTDLDAAAFLSSPDPDGGIVLDLGDAIYPSTADHSYGIGGQDRIHSDEIKNAWAGTWTTELGVADGDQDVTFVDGPSIRVLRAAKVTAKAGPTKPKKGKTVTVSGTLSRANWESGKDGAYAKQSVKLQYRTKSGTFATVKTVTSSSKGAVTAGVKATKDGYFRFVFAGTSTTATATSPSAFVDVK